MQNLEKVTSVAEQVLSPLGLTLVDVKLGQQGKRRTLEVTIFRSNGRISLEDCEKVSKQLGEQLDSQDPPLLEGAYVLEVQSPGIDRKLSSHREFSLFAGQPVEVKTKQKVQTLGSAFTGQLIGITDDERVVIGQPQKVSDKAKSNKTKNIVESDAPQQVEVELSNIIHVQLIPQPVKDAAESRA